LAVALLGLSGDVWHSTEMADRARAKAAALAVLTPQENEVILREGWIQRCADVLSVAGV